MGFLNNTRYSVCDGDPGSAWLVAPEHFLLRIPNVYRHRNCRILGTTLVSDVSLQVFILRVVHFSRVLYDQVVWIITEAIMFLRWQFCSMISSFPGCGLKTGSKENA